jgi:hypothetical protein
VRGTKGIKQLYFAFIAMSSLSAVTTATKAEEHRDPQIDRPGNSYPPILLTLPLTDGLSSATLGSSRRSPDVQVLIDSFAAGNERWSDIEVKALLKSQVQLESTISKQRIGINAAQFMSDKLVDMGSTQLAKRYTSVSIFSGFLADLTKKGLGSYYDKKRRELDEQLVRNLRIHLDEISSANDPTADDVRKYYRQHDEALLGTDILRELRKTASPAEVQEIEVNELERLITLFAKGMTRIDKQLAKGDPKKAQPPDGKSENNDASSSAQFLLFQQQTNAKLAELGKGQQGLVDSVRALAENISLNNSKIDDIYKMMYSQLPASQQRKMLEQSLKGKTPTDSDKQILEGLEAKELFEETMPALSAHLGELATIAKNAHMPDGTQRAIQNFQWYVNTIQTTGQAMVSYNVLGYFAGVTSLMEGPGADPEDLRFKAVMEQLTEIRKNQLLMMEMLVSLEGSIIKIASAIESVDEHVAAVALAVRDGVEVTYGLRDCETLNGARLVQDAGFTNADGNFKSFEDRRKHYAKYRDVFATCMSGLRRAFIQTPKSDFSQLFQQDFATDSANKPLSFEAAQRYRHVISLVLQHPSFKNLKSSEYDKALNQLFAASLSNSFVNLRSFGPDAKMGEPDTSTFFPLLKTKYLSILAIDRYVRYLLEYYPYFIFANQKSELEMPAALVRNENRQSLQDSQAVVSHMLVSALRIVNTSIVQTDLTDNIAAQSINESFLSWRWPPTTFCEQNVVGGATTYDEQRRKGTIATRERFISDNQETFLLLERRDSLRRNWVNALATDVLADTKNVKMRNSFNKLWPDASASQEVGYLADIFLGQTYQSVQERVQHPNSTCGATLVSILFPSRMARGSVAIPAYGTMNVPSVTNPSEPIKVDLPNTIDVNDPLLAQTEHGPEMFLLRSLRRQLLVALTQIHGFANLTARQQRLAAFMLIQNTYPE